MTDETQKRFDATLRNLLSSPPEKQADVARVRRRNKHARKAEIAEIETLAATARAYANVGGDGLDDEATLIRYLNSADRIANALDEFAEFTRQLPPRTVNT